VDRIQLGWTGEAAVAGVQLSARDSAGQPAVSAQSVTWDGGLLSLLRGELVRIAAAVNAYSEYVEVCAKCSPKLTMLSAAHLCCSAGQPAQISIKGLTLDGMLDDTGEFRILQLLPSNKPGETTVAAFVHRCLHKHRKFQQSVQRPVRRCRDSLQQGAGGRCRPAAA
jgi:hypothetical protein